ncbi:VirD4-like conjugal transfer protein, CD1115 family [Schaalia georgiae]|uniref:VirD4-like conjugal transfer protein, CD1115 family n=1 Tax=Schaalia georgiae TaxID=52768 RepID=UPI00041F3789|nr:type IV secretory system conjugative DNA transfer family protein [Schaalia georgiae]
MDKSRVRAPVVVGALCLLAWAVGDKISYQVRSIVRGGGTVGDVLDGFWKDLPVLTHFSFDGPDVLAGVITSALMLLAVVYRIGARTNIRAHQEHGSARWGGPRDIRPMVDPDPARNLLLTRTECLSLDTRATRRNLNTLVVGASGTGKTSRFVVPNLLQASTSYVVTDPGGRVKAATEGHLRANGYEIRTLDLVNPAAHGDSFNPFAHIDAGNAEVELLILVDALLANTAPMPGALHDALSDNAERALLAALCAQAYASDPHGASLGAVADLLAQLDAAGGDGGALFAGGANPDPGGPEWLLADEAAVRREQIREFARSQYAAYSQGPDSTRLAVRASLGSRLAPLRIVSIRRALSSDTIGTELIGQRKTAVFLVVPDSHRSLDFLVSLFYDLVVRVNSAAADRSPGGRLPVPVQCFMDDFATVGRIPGFEAKLGVMGKRGISACVIVQTYSQGRALYGDDWEGIVGNCDSKLFMGGDEETTLRWIVGRLGRETIDTVDSATVKGSVGAFSQSWRRLGRELLTADELAGLDPGRCVFALRGLPPFLSDKLPAREP